MVENGLSTNNPADTTDTAGPTIWTPHTTVAAVVERDNHFLIVEEPKNGRIVFNQPAGHLEDNESLIDAIIREVREETAWGFTPEYLLGVYLWKLPEKSRTYLRFTFVGSVHDHDPNQTLFDGILSANWKTLSDLHSNTAQLRSPMVLSCINDYLAGHRYPLDLLHNINQKK